MLQLYPYIRCTLMQMLRCVMYIRNDVWWYCELVHWSKTMIFHTHSNVCCLNIYYGCRCSRVLLKTQVITAYIKHRWYFISVCPLACGIMSPQQHTVYLNLYTCIILLSRRDHVFFNTLWTICVIGVSILSKICNYLYVLLMLLIYI